MVLVSGSGLRLCPNSGGSTIPQARVLIGCTSRTVYVQVFKAAYLHSYFSDLCQPLGLRSSHVNVCVWQLYYFQSANMAMFPHFSSRLLHFFGLKVRRLFSTSGTAVHE